MRLANLDRAIDILETIVPIFGQHPSLNFLLAFGMYYGDREFDDVIHYTREAFAGVTERAKNIERASTSNSKPKEGFPKLQEWAKPAEFHAKNLLAYMAAQAGKYEIMAERFAEENYKNLDSMTYSNLWNNSDRVAFADTYGYVLMAIGARKSPIDVTAIQRAHRLLVEARSAARRLSLKDRRVAEVTIESHLRQAEKLLAQVR